MINNSKNSKINSSQSSSDPKNKRSSNPKGVHRVRKKLASGKIATYYYAWRKGPRLEGEPGTRKFKVSYEEALQARPKAKTLGEVMGAYEKSSEFEQLAQRTKLEYAKHLQALKEIFGSVSVERLGRPGIRGEILAWRDELARATPRMADYRMSVLARALNWAKHREIVPTNPCGNPGRVHRANRRDKIWSEDDEAAFLIAASEPMRLAFLLAFWTGQRQGDILRLTWRAYDGRAIRLRQGKTGARVVVPVGAPLRAALEQAREKMPAVVSAGLPLLVGPGNGFWKADYFRTVWRKTSVKAGIGDLTFHDLRGTAVTRLALAGCTIPEIAAITGHSLKTVEAILDEHYLSRDPRLGESAIRKLEGATHKDSEESARKERDRRGILQGIRNFFVSAVPSRKLSSRQMAPG